MPATFSILPFRRIAGVNNRRVPVDHTGIAQNCQKALLFCRPQNGQRFDAHGERAIGRLFVMDHFGFDPAINRSRWDCCDYGGLFGGDHKGVARQTFDAERGQRTARLPDDIDFMYLDRLFCSAPFCHAVSP